MTSRNNDNRYKRFKTPIKRNSNKEELNQIREYKWEENIGPVKQIMNNKLEIEVKSKNKIKMFFALKEYK